MSARSLFSVVVADNVPETIEAATKLADVTRLSIDLLGALSLGEKTKIRKELLLCLNDLKSCRLVDGDFVDLLWAKVQAGLKLRPV